MQQMVTQCYKQPARSHATVFMSLEGLQRLALGVMLLVSYNRWLGIPGVLWTGRRY
jgi:hypothetical protein